MRNTLLLTLAACLLLSPMSHAQAPEADDSQHPTVVEFAKRLLQVKTLRAHVETKMDNQQADMKLTYKGDIEMRGSEYKFRGMGMEVYSNGRERWQYLPKEKEVTVYAVDSTDHSPIAQPLGIVKGYRDMYKVRFRGERTEGRTTYYDISLYPKDMNAAYSQIHLAILKKDLSPSKITYRGKDGVHYTVEISRFEPNAKLSKDFAADPRKIKGVEVIDLR
ncbi:MAG: hypothetical protein CSA07_03360 [Bacteroidia bacterium]|nr:MAG: hypothetical protein CSA07_03360 [Bacteroidia bacterium]